MIQKFARCVYPFLALKSEKPPALLRELTAGLGLLTSNRYTTASYCGMAKNPRRMN